MIDSILDALSYVGDSLDKAGPRPLRGLLAGKPREALSFVPFSDELGLTDPNDIRTGRHVTDHFGLTDPGDKGWGATGMGMMADALIDPTAIAGTALAGRAGIKSLLRDIHGPRRGMMALPAFPGAHQAINNAADWIGPMHNPDAGQRSLMAGILKRLGTSHTDPRTLEYMHKLNALDPQTRSRVFGELPEGAGMLAHGGEGPVFESPGGMITKIQPAKSRFNAPTDEIYHEVAGHWPSTGRADIPEMLSPIRSNVFGGMEHGLSVEHLHPVTPLNQQYNTLANSLSDLKMALSPELRNSPDMREMGSHLRGVGKSNEDLVQEMLMSLGVGDEPGNFRSTLTPWDVNGRNLSITPGNRLVIHDAGAIGGSGASFLPQPSVNQPSEELMRAMIESGAPHRVREAMDAALAGGTRSGIPIPGDLLQQRASAISALQDFLAHHEGVIKQAKEQHSDSILAALLGSGPTSPYTPVSSFDLSKIAARHRDIGGAR